MRAVPFPLFSQLFQIKKTPKGLSAFVKNRLPIITLKPPPTSITIALLFNSPVFKTLKLPGLPILLWSIFPLWPIFGSNLRAIVLRSRLYPSLLNLPSFKSAARLLVVTSLLFQSPEFVFAAL